MSLDADLSSDHDMSDVSDLNEMSADRPGDPGTDPSTDAPAARPSPDPTRRAAASAASRARRIGGRPVTRGGSPEPAAPTDPVGAEAAEPEQGAAAPTRERPTPAGRRRPRPGRPDVTPTGSGTDERSRHAAAEAQPARPARARTAVDHLRRGFLAVAALAVAVTAGASVWFSHGVWWATGDAGTSQSQQVRQQVLAAASTCFAAITSYDYRTLAKSEAAGLACTTGVFKTDYQKTMETTVKTLAPQSKTVQVYQGDKEGIVSVSPTGTQFVVLLYGQQSVTNTSTGTSSPQLEILSGRMTLDKVGGKWLVSALAQA